MKLLNKKGAFLLAVLAVSFALDARPHRSAENVGRRAFLTRADICKERKSAVLQVFTYCNHLDIFEPFRAPEQSMARGSGVFISGDGYALTNFHVVENAVGIYAQTSLSGKEHFKMEFVGGCPQRDVALLRFTSESMERYKDITNQKSVPFVELGDSDKIVEGDAIILLGHPGGEEEVKITPGYVRGRTIISGAALIQTTAPVNPGDSGGPFFDEHGQMIGLCVAKKVNAECFGYIIPTTNITLMFDDLVSNKILRLPHWGLSFIPSNASTRAYLKCPEEGVYVADICVGSLAAQAGFKRGDIVTAINGRKLDESGYLFVDWTPEKVSVTDYINRLTIGSDVEISYYRNGISGSANITSAVKKVSEVDFFYPCFEEQPSYEIFAGMVVSQLTLNHVMAMVQSGGIELALMKYTQEESVLEPRLLITSIFNTSALHLSRALTRRVNLLSKINGRQVSTIKEFREAVLAGKKEQFLTIETESGAFVALPMQEILKEEDRLSELYHYKQSDLVFLLKR